MNIINGGAHADNDLNIQEFMIRPDSANNFMDAIEKKLSSDPKFAKIIEIKKMLTNVGDEGGLLLQSILTDEALKLIVDLIEKSNLKPGKDIVICLDVAANELINDKGNIQFNQKSFTSYR